MATSLFFFVFVFFVVLFHIERNLVAMLPLKSKLSGKFQRFNAIDKSIEMLKIVEFSKISIKMKSCKIFCKAQTVSHLKEIIQPHLHTPHQIKPYHASETKIFS